MTRHRLIPHPDFPPLAVRGVTVDVTGDGGVFELIYRVEAAGEVIWPEPAIPARKDGLWQATCFELFLKPDGGSAYVEFNFAPSREWAAYAFDAYRAGMRDLACAAVPKIERRREGVDVRCDLSTSSREAMGMALTAVIEERGGRRSFWSLAHAPGAPDFHHDDCFVARLPAPEQP